MENKTHTLTLQQLKDMNLPPFLELAYFGRTSEDWEIQLQNNNGSSNETLGTSKSE